MKGSSVLKYDPTGAAAEGVPRPREGGAQWRESARACVRARSPSSSGRPRPRSARPSARRRRGAGRAPTVERAREPHEQPAEHVPPRSQREREREPVTSRSAGDAVAGARARRPTAAPARAERTPRARRAALRAAPEPLPEPAPRLHRAPRPDSAAYLAVIRVVGVGGAGLNAINRMIDAGHHAGRVRRGQHRHPAAADVRGADEAPHRPRADAGPRLRLRPGSSAAGPPRRRTTRSSTRSAARTWSSSPPARAAAPARAPRPSSRGSRASSARSRSAS